MTIPFDTISFSFRIIMLCPSVSKACVRSIYIFIGISSLSIVFVMLSSTACSVKCPL